MLTGSYPFHHDDLNEVVRMHLTVPTPLPSARVPVSPAMDAVVTRAMDKLPARRFASALEFITALRAAVTDEEPTAAPAGVTVVVECRPASDVDPEDLSVIDHIAATIDQAARILRAAGLEILVETGVTVVAAVGDGDEARRLAAVIAADLDRELADRRSQQTRLTIDVAA
jgi:serine/threonine-protein kinase